MLEGIQIVDFTAPTLLGIAILLLLTGRLVTRAVLNDKDKEAERWRMAYEAEREAREAADAQTAELLEVAKTTHALLTAIFSTVDRHRSTGDPDATKRPR